MGHERRLISTNVVIHDTFLWKKIIQKVSTPTAYTGRTYKINNED